MCISRAITNLNLSQGNVSLSLKNGKKLIILLTLVTGMGSLGAQVTTSNRNEAKDIRGHVTSATDNEAVAYANVALMRAADSIFLRGTMTDQKGNFHLTGDTAACLIRCSAMGYKTQWVVLNGNGEALQVVMQQSSTTLDMVQITAERPLFSVEGEKELYNVSDDASVQTGNGRDVLQNAPGVQVDAEGNITLDGNSVSLWINNRPSRLTGEAQKQYLKNLPANTISRVEVIKSPSAKYVDNDPIVNIITTRKTSYSSFVSLGANGTSKPSVAPWVSYIYNDEKLSINAYLSYFGDYYHTSSNSHTRLLDNDSVLVDESQSLTQGTELSHNLWMNINANYKIDGKNSITTWVNAYPGYTFKEDSTRTQRSYMGADFGSTAASKSQGPFAGGDAGAEYVHLFNNEGHHLSVNALYRLIANQQEGSGWARYPNQPRMNYQHQTTNSQWDNSLYVMTDYTWPYSKQGTLEMGGYIGWGNEINNKLRDTADAMGYYHTDYLRSDTNNSPNLSVSTYLMWKRKWGGFTLKVGSRLSYWESHNSHKNEPQYDVTKQVLYPRPTVHLSYCTKNLHNFTLKCRYHKSLPVAKAYSSYEDYAIESISTGTSQMQTTQYLQVGFAWNKYYKQFGTVGLTADHSMLYNQSYKVTTACYKEYFGRMVPVTKYSDQCNQQQSTLSANVMYRPTAFLNIKLTLGGTYNRFSAEVKTGNWVEDWQLGWSANLRVWTKLWNKLELFATGHYSSLQYDAKRAFNTLEPDKYIDLGMSADFLNRRLSLYLNCADIFNWNEKGVTGTYPYYNGTTTTKKTSRYITFGLTLRFGKMDLEKKAKTGATEESGLKMLGSGE